MTAGRPMPSAFAQASLGPLGGPRRAGAGVTRMSSSGLVPREGGTPEVSLAALGVNFSLDDVIVKGLIKEKIANLEEFRFFFHDGWGPSGNLGD